MCAMDGGAHRPLNVEEHDRAEGLAFRNLRRVMFRMRAFFHVCMCIFSCVSNRLGACDCQRPVKVVR